MEECMPLARTASRRSFAALVLAASLSTAAFAADYDVTDLGSLGHPQGSGVVSLNGRGASAGYAFVAGSPYVHAMLNRYGTVLDLGTLGGTQSLARSVNQLGWVVGWAYRQGSNTQQAFLWRDGTMQALGDFGGGRSDASAVNEDGVVVGSAYTAQTHEHAFWWKDGVMTDMGTLGGTTSRAYDVNSRHIICGMSSPTLGRYHAFVAKPGEPMQDLGTLGGEAAHAYAINDLDEIVGWSYLSESSPESRAWRFRGLGLEPLPTLGGVYGAAFGINNLGDIVGAASDRREAQRAVLWRAEQIYDLNTLIAPSAGWVLTRAWDIDDQGAIVGEGLRNGEPRGFLLTPSGTTGAPGAALPASVEFAGALPNPVHGRARFHFALPRPARVRIELFDAGGRRVRELADGVYGAGAGQVAWDGADERGAAAPGGVYWARFAAGDVTIVRRVAVLR
jgi:probable HAF family extracellular repeat protein